LRGLEEYYYTAFESAVQFLEDLDAKKLKIEVEDFDRNVNENRNRLGLPTTVAPYQDLESNGKASHKNSINGINGQKEINRFNVEFTEKDNNEEIVKEIIKKFSQLKNFTTFDPKNQRFYGIESDKLLIKDVNELLEDYKKLCNQHLDLCKKVEEIRNVIEEKSNQNTKPNSKKLWNLFKFS